VVILTALLIGHVAQLSLHIPSLEYFGTAGVALNRIAVLCPDRGSKSTHVDAEDELDLTRALDQVFIRLMIFASR
jgi:hypothetical protein